MTSGAPSACKARASTAPMPPLPPASTQTRPLSVPWSATPTSDLERLTVTEHGELAGSTLVPRLVAGKRLRRDHHDLVARRRVLAEVDLEIGVDQRRARER